VKSTNCRVAHYMGFFHPPRTRPRHGRPGQANSLASLQTEIL
jgi:hypothetical protein